MKDELLFCPLGGSGEIGMNMNLFGYGETSAWPKKKRQTLKDQAALVIAIAEMLEEPVSLVGHSFGGSVAMKAALNLNERVERLILIEPNPFYLLNDHGRMEAYRDKSKGWGIWQINITDTDQYIGWVLVRPMNFFSDMPEFDNLELGWRFFQSSWGKGFASESAAHIKNHLAENKTYNAFSAIADEENLGSIGVMKNIGMSYLKTYHHQDPLFECQVAYYQASNN